jgi:hypothetical protein
MQAPSPKRDSRLKGCSALKGPPVKAQARRRCPALTVEPRKPGKRALTTKPEVARWSARFSKLPRFGMSKKPPVLLEFGTDRADKIHLSAPVAGAGIGECNWRLVFISRRREIPKYGFAYRPAASILTRARLARCLRASSRPRSKPHGDQRQILLVSPCGAAMDSHAGGARPVAARNGAPICRNTVWPREHFSGR